MKGRFEPSPARPDASFTELLRLIHARLGEKTPKALELEGDSVRFTSGALFMLKRGHLLNGVSGGKVTVDAASRQVSWEIDQLRSTLINAGTVAFMALFMFLAKIPTPLLGAVAAFMTLWVIGGNYLFVALRFRGFVKRCIREAGFFEKDYPSRSGPC
ncbi:MAG: hypothetical protein U1F66_05885 [bacterium]